jgi:hypothetical protein
MPPILHGVIREGTVAVLCDRLRIAPASGGYGLSAEAQLHRYASIRNIQGGKRKTRSGWSEGRDLLLPTMLGDNASRCNDVSYTKRMMEEEEARGYETSSDVICAECFDDPGIVRFIEDHLACIQDLLALRTNK